MIVLVTGASGFLGGRVAQLVARRAGSVRILARRTSDLQHLSGVPAHIYYGDLSDTAALADVARDVTHIIHCAGCSTDWARWAQYHDANVAGVENLLKAAAGSGTLARFLHVSSTDVYGYPHDPCDESHVLTDVKLPYNRSKCQGEERVLAESRNSGLPVTIVRPATIYGPRGKAFSMDVAKLIRHGMMAVIDGGRSPGGFCYVDNAADAMIDAALSPATLGHAYNLADGTNATWRDYLDRLADGLGRRRPWIDIPSRVALPMAGAFESVHRNLRLPGSPILTRHAVLLLSRNQEYNSEKAKRDFGFRPEISFDEGMGRTIEWLKREGM